MAVADLIASGLAEIVFAVVVVGLIMWLPYVDCGPKHNSGHMLMCQFAMAIHGILQCLLSLALPDGLWYYGGSWFLVIFCILSWVVPLRFFFESFSDKLRGKKWWLFLMFFCFIILSIQYVWIFIEFMRR
ncbi:unnamed protein product [Vitrella brassicaformis CCMP3155]|uniref:Uncharacterized protein n=2 Tax=Vitrella brassicaformis TaxID=1169539 RepID=A0A0G4GBH0_VITBC|nr:unnamed protein product [Vitrella brassicaformis CCMP3155]|mmetsp:Transcript_24398/g.60224  ORF Transcript_24398/g.60224 Transcript_24398/m.60224 type:complete len:130 (+) Transcript_24398:97-486(+)|eukprot:CEM26467.1 unnamed protein product [Vitrella brassicaformis CCMP3155]